MINIPPTFNLLRFFQPVDFHVFSSLHERNTQMEMKINYADKPKKRIENKKDRNENWSPERQPENSNESKPRKSTGYDFK